MPAMRSVQYLAVVSTTAKFTLPMDAGQEYLFISNVDCWVKTTVTGGAAAANTADNVLYIAGMQLVLSNPDKIGNTNAFVHVIRDVGDGDAVLALME